DMKLLFALDLNDDCAGQRFLLGLARLQRRPLDNVQVQPSTVAGVAGQFAPGGDSLAIDLLADAEHDQGPGCLVLALAGLVAGGGVLAGEEVLDRLVGLENVLAPLDADLSFGPGQQEQGALGIGNLDRDLSLKPAGEQTDESTGRQGATI